MNLLGGYGSDGSGDESSEDAQGPAAKVPRLSKPPANESAAKSSSGKKVVNFAKLPIRRPLVLDDTDKPEDAPLRKAAQAEALRNQVGRSLLAALPAPKVTLAVDADMNSSGSRIDLSDIKLSRASMQRDDTSGVLHRPRASERGSLGVSAPDVAENGEVPAEFMNHPMFRGDATAGAGGDRPSLEELDRMTSKGMKFVSIKATDVQDPDWYMKNIQNGGPGLTSGRPKEEVSMYESKTWEKTTHANPSKNQKKKHQINWLAHEAMEKEGEMLDMAAQNRQTKAQTSLKYGW